MEKQFIRLFGVLMFFGLVSCNSSQPDEEPYFIKDNTFHMQVLNGINEEVPMKFRLPSLEKWNISRSKIFREWEKNRPKNNGLDPMEVFLMGKVLSANIETMFQFKNPTSYVPIDKGSGSISYDKDNESIIIRFPVKAQNGYGNYITSMAVYSIKYESGKEVADIVIY